MRKARDLLSSEPASPAEAYLGMAHPVCQAERDVQGVMRQIVSLCVFLVTLRVLTRTDAARVCIILGLAALAVLVTRAVSLLVVRDGRVLDAIAQGWELTPLRSVRRARRRLLAPKRRHSYADELEENRQRVLTNLRASSDASASPGERQDPAPGRELETTAQLLRRSDLSSARGVALCERLLRDGLDSPLYGPDMDALRRELGRIRFFLVQ